MAVIAGLLAATAALTRPDGAIYAAVFPILAVHLGGGSSGAATLSRVRAYADKTVPEVEARNTAAPRGDCTDTFVP